MTNALIIIIFPRIVKFHFPQEKNKVFILSILFSQFFGSFSGLLMNKNKTGGIWVGKLKHSKDKIEGIK
jgi:hypothetical protein